MCETNPKIFISYAWSNTERVIELAQRLKNDGIVVVIDNWGLKEGQDKYAFMEQSVTDDTINKVLIICDKAYAEKADNRKGGVGDETIIISTEVYGKVSQEKFIPVIFERDENGNEYVPAYLKSRIYIDLSSSDIEQYENNYEKLLQNLYNKPKYYEPPLGKKPEWLNEETVSFTPIRALIRQLKIVDDKNQAKQNYIVKHFNDEFFKVLNELAPQNDADFDVNLLKQIDAAKPLRDLFLDYVETLISTNHTTGNILGDFFEFIYNSVYHVDGSCYSSNDHKFEFGFFMIWEMFICTTAILLHFERYADLYDMLYRTYFLHERPTNQNTNQKFFTHFRTDNSYIEDNVKPQSPNPRLYTLAGDIIVKREKKPIITQYTIANADIVLYQLSCVYSFVQNSSQQYWFPTSYRYLGASYGTQLIWSKMVSRKHCEKLFPLFGVSSNKELIEAVNRNQPDKYMRFSNCSPFDVAPSILNSIELEKIGTMP